jgi:hypothetical protein
VPSAGVVTMGDIEVFEEVFDPRFCAFLLKDAQSNLASGEEFTISNYQWDPGIVRASAPVLIRRYRGALREIILGHLVKRGMIETTEFTVMNYAWSRMSYIPWHNDGIHEVAITVYLNDVWNLNWGGIFLYMAGEPASIRGYAPKFNTAVKNSGQIAHATTMVTIDAKSPRFTLQLFPIDSKIGISPERSDLSLAGSLSTMATSDPNSAKQAPETKPT